MQECKVCPIKPHLFAALASLRYPARCRKSAEVEAILSTAAADSGEGEEEEEEDGASSSRDSRRWDRHSVNKSTSSSS